MPFKEREEACCKKGVVSKETKSHAPELINTRNFLLTFLKVHHILQFTFKGRDFSKEKNVSNEFLCLIDGFTLIRKS